MLSLKKKVNQGFASEERQMDSGEAMRLKVNKKLGFATKSIRQR